MKIMVECPVCSAKVEEGKINKHMDGPECKLEGSDVEILEESNKGTPKPETKEKTKEEIVSELKLKID